jgi:hypothetical protein
MRCHQRAYVQKDPFLYSIKRRYFIQKY